MFDPAIIARLVDVPASAENGSAARLLIRGTLYRGKLTRLGITLVARQGRDLAVEATMFVPLLAPGEAWTLPNFVGLDGFLERLCFAVDPTENAFYFGRV